MKLNKEQAEILAQKFRADNQLSCTEAISMKSIVRQLNILMVYLPLSEQASGLSLKSPSGDMFILVNSNTPRGRQHFIIAHELFHLFYDEAPHPHLCKEDGNSSTEKSAHLFASALLMPKEGIYKMLLPRTLIDKELPISTILRLEQYFEVSRDAMLIRLRNLGIIKNEEQYQRLKKINPISSAREYGYDTALYRNGNKDVTIGPYGEKARMLFEQGIISEGHYNELLSKIPNAEDPNRN